MTGSAQSATDDFATAPEPPATSGRSRVFWTFFDQALSSLTNAALAIVVARTVSDAAFGAFSLALVTFSFTIGIGRGLISDPFVVRYSDVRRDVRQAAVTRATGAALAYGVLAGLICAGAAQWVGGLAAGPLLALAVCLPGLMVQDVWRHAFFAAGQPAKAALNDGIWAVVQFGALGLLLIGGYRQVELITLAWGLAAAAAAVLGVAQAGAIPRPQAWLAWLQETRDLSLRMALDFSLNMGAIHLATLLVGALVGLAGVGGLRAAQVLLGPLNLVFAGLSSFVLPVLARQAGAARSLLRTVTLSSLVTAGVAAGWVLFLLLLPPAAGKEILGDSWPRARAVMVPSGILVVAVGIVTGPALGLRALRRADLMLLVTYIQAPLMLGLGAFGAWSGGEVWAAYGFATAQVVGMTACWIIFLRANREPRPWIQGREHELEPV